MHFHIKQSRVPSTMETVVSFCGEISSNDLMKMHFDPLDLALLNETKIDEKVFPADHLLVLEMIFRRYKEQIDAG